MTRLVDDASSGSIPIWFATQANWAAVQAELSTEARAYAASVGFKPEAGAPPICLPGAGGGLAAVLVGASNAGKLATSLPDAIYCFANEPAEGAEAAATNWLLSSYSYRKSHEGAAKIFPRLAAPAGVDAHKLNRLAQAVFFGRDLINAPANEMGPAALEQAALSLAARCGAQARAIRGSQLVEEGFPLILAVGAAAAEEPRLVDLTYGDPKAPKVTLIGKGVCFDSGGLDIKPSSAMALMKKDMAGAAVALSLGKLIMESALPIRLRILLPIVENAISARSFRPGDVYASRKGLFVEIGNTDAEGRLILADALTLAEEEAPDLLFDFATLTGAARVALGPDLPPFYTHDEQLAAEVAASGAAVNDPVWRLPLWKPYDKLLESKIADLNNISASPFAGSIIAALFLARFVAPERQWAHFDIFGWSPTTQPGRPEGADVQTVRLLFNLLSQRYSAA